MTVEQREARLTAQALQGNRDAFGDLYELYLEEVYRYVFYRVGSEADAEDLTEQVFLNAWENLPNFLQSVHFKAWLYRIARNTVIDHYRTRKKILPLNEKASFVAMDDQPDDKFLAKETTVRLIQAISKLSQLHQDVIILRFANGFSTTETAQILERNVGTVRVLQHRALKAMQSYLVAEEIVHG